MKNSEADSQDADAQPWARPMPGENARWFERFSRYLAMGPARSVRGVYNAERGNTISKAVPASWSEAAKRYEWQRRAEAYDAWQRQQILHQSFARDTERIRHVNDLLERLHHRITAGIEQLDITDRTLERYIQLLDLHIKQTGGYPRPAPEPKQARAGAGAGDEGEERTMQVLFYLPRSPELDAPDSDSAVAEKKGEERHES